MLRRQVRRRYGRGGGSARHDLPRTAGGDESAVARCPLRSSAQLPGRAHRRGPGAGPGAGRADRDQGPRGPGGRRRASSWPRSTTPRPRWNSAWPWPSWRRPRRRPATTSTSATPSRRPRWPRPNTKSTPRPTARSPARVPQVELNELLLKMKRPSWRIDKSKLDQRVAGDEASVAQAEADAAQEDINRRQIRSPVGRRGRRAAPPPGRMGPAGRPGAARHPHGPAVGRGLRRGQGFQPRRAPGPPGHGRRSRLARGQAVTSPARWSSPSPRPRPAARSWSAPRSRTRSRTVTGCSARASAPRCTSSCDNRRMRMEDRMKRPEANGLRENQIPDPKSQIPHGHPSRQPALQFRPEAIAPQAAGPDRPPPPLPGPQLLDRQGPGRA